MKKMILFSVVLAVLCSAGFGQEKVKKNGQYGLNFEGTDIGWLSFSGVSLNLGLNAGTKTRFELAATYYPLFFRDGGGTTLVGFSAALLGRVAEFSRLSIFVGPGFRLTGVLSDHESMWTPAILLKGLVEYRIGAGWGMRAGIVQSLSFPSEDYDEYSYRKMASGVEWGFFWHF
jgi:hypothetical protein